MSIRAAVQPIVPMARVAARDRRSDALPATPAATPRQRLEAALDWLARAQDVTPDDGVSYGFSLRGGWLPSYRETTGYILTTFLRAAEALDRPDLAARAVRAARWLVSVQNPDGSFANPKYGPEGIVFDTGQDLFGLVGAYRHTGDDAFLDAARAAGDWLVRVADDSGIWTRHEHKGTPHVYNTRTAWALVQLFNDTGVGDYERIARANLDWAVESQLPSGFFLNNAFEAGDDPYTHNISYAICGLQESGWLLADDAYVSAARRCSDAVLDRMRPDGFVSGQISPEGSADRSYSCLTGQAQLAIVWGTQFNATGEERLREASRRSLDFVARTQILHDRSDGVRGAIAGSYPIWGRYAPFSYPNWAAKFFVDALVLHKDWADQ
ncbi:beta-L-arabinofuranosidase domain-containing protein [Actinomycetota bacterium]